MMVKPHLTPVVKNESCKRTSIFNTAVLYKGQSCSHFIDSGSVLNEGSQDLVNKLGLTTKPLTKSCQVAWINSEKMTISLKCKMDFLFGKSCKETKLCCIVDDGWAYFTWITMALRPPSCT